MDELDKKLLKELQNEFPLTSKPFQKVAERLEWNEDEVISRLSNLLKSGEVRKFGAIIAPKKIGYVSILAAADVPEEKLEDAAELINAYPGVTHNYQREGTPNLWFTMIEPDKETIEKNLKVIEASIGASIIRLPASKTYKIGVKFDL